MTSEYKKREITQSTEYWALKEADLPLEVVFLLIGAMALVITAILLYMASYGALPYYENGSYGLLLFIFSLQMLTLGKTPFGDMRRSKLLFAAAVILAVAGFVTCLTPIFNRLPRMLLLLCLGPGGLLQLLRMCFSRDNFRAWINYGGIFLHLILACSGIYVLSMLIALVLWNQSQVATPITAAVVLIYGLVGLYLAAVLRKIYRTYPEPDARLKEDINYSFEQVMLLMTGLFLLIVGVMLIPVSLGLLPFSGSAQLGLLMVFFSVQMLASGSTPIGPFPRSWLMIAFGLLFAALGIVSSIVPDILVAPLTVLVAVLNILGGVIPLMKIRMPALRPSENASDPVPALLARLSLVRLTMNLLQIMFGTSMLIPNLVPLMVLGVILAANGCFLLYLLHILSVLDKMRRDVQGTAGETV